MGNLQGVEEMFATSNGAASDGMLIVAPILDVSAFEIDVENL